MSTIFYSLSLSLFDSLSTTQQIIIFILLLTTVNPLRNALWYLAGLCGSYLACGIGGFFVLDQLRTVLGRFFPSTTAIPGPLYYRSEFLAGIIMAAIGFWYFRAKRRRGPSRAQNMIVAKLRSMNRAFALGIGVLISITSFPVSIPYVLALGKYAALHLRLPQAIGCILLYNLGYALPMLVVLVMYLIARRGAGVHNDTLHEKARMLNVHLTTWAFAGAGIFSMLDAGSYFALGHALVKGRFF